MRFISVIKIIIKPIFGTKNAKYTKIYNHNMRKLILVLSLASISGLVAAQVGSNFPKMKEKNLLNNEVKLPDDVAGKFTIIGIAAKIEAQNDLQSWFEPMDDESLLDDPDVNARFIAVVSGYSDANVKQIKEAAQEALLTELHPKVLLFRGDKKQLFQDLKCSFHAKFESI